MKKLSIILVALVAVFAVACKKSSPVDTIVKMMNDYTEKISKAASLEDVMKIGQDMEKEYGEFAEKAVKEYGEDFQPSADEQKLLQKRQRLQLRANNHLFQKRLRGCGFHILFFIRVLL